MAKATSAPVDEFEDFGGIEKIPVANLADLQAGPLILPIEFDSQRYASKWQFTGTNVERSEQKEIIGRTGLAAPGWRVWKHPNTNRIEERPLSRGKVVLMYRPKKVQLEVNKLYGNISSDRMEAERKGETVLAGEGGEGLLSAKQLGKDPRDLETGPMPRGAFGDDPYRAANIEID